MRLSAVLEGIEVLGLLGDPDTEITGVVYDSRKAAPGCMFAAVKGGKVDGGLFMEMAAGKGAAAVMHGGDSACPPGVACVRVGDARDAMARAAANFYGRPSRGMRLVGITGTNGKTTTSYIVRSVIEASGGVAGLVGTIGYEVGGRAFPAPNTTPESVDLQALLAGMRDAGAGYAVVEVSSHAVALKRINGCEFAARVFTNFTQDHLDFHGDMDSYYAAKKAFFTSRELGGMSVINMDDPRGADLAASASGAVTTYGTGPGADIRAADVRLGRDGLRFVMETRSGAVEIASGLAGGHNVHNILAAAGACLALGVSLPDVAAGVAALPGVPGRLERVDAGQGFTVLVDYAHTEDALERAIDAARALTAGRLITVFGCGGDRDRTKRPRMGRAAARLSDIVVLTSDNPRSEDPDAIMDEVEAGVREDGTKKAGEGYLRFTDRAEAISRAIALAAPGDTVLIAGKGHEDYQIIGETRYHFDDRLAARDAILARGL